MLISGQEKFKRKRGGREVYMGNDRIAGDLPAGIDGSGKPRIPER